MAIWIPKKEANWLVSNFRQLGIMTAPFPLLSRLLRSMIMEGIAPRMHPAQCFVNSGMDMGAMTTAVQDFIDGAEMPTASASR